MLMKKKWDEKWSHAENMMIYFQKRKKNLIMRVVFWMQKHVF